MGMLGAPMQGRVLQTLWAAFATVLSKNSKRKTRKGPYFDMHFIPLHIFYHNSLVRSLGASLTCVSQRTTRVTWGLTR